MVHAGIYYPANNLKAKLCVEGRQMLYEYAAQRNVPHKRMGKLVVATHNRWTHTPDKVCVCV